MAHHVPAQTYLLLLLIVLRDFEDGWNVVAKIQFLQGSLDVFARYGLFGVFFGDLVGLGGDEGDELYAAFNEEIA